MESLDSSQHQFSVHETPNQITTSISRALSSLQEIDKKIHELTSNLLGHETPISCPDIRSIHTVHQHISEMNKVVEETEKIIQAILPGTHHEKIAELKKIVQDHAQTTQKALEDYFNSKMRPSSLPMYQETERIQHEIERLRKEIDGLPPQIQDIAQRTLDSVIAKRVLQTAQTDPLKAFDQLQKCKIQNRSIFFNLAKTLTEKAPKTMLMFLEEQPPLFDFSEEEQFKIATICAKEQPNQTCKQIDSFHIRTEAQRAKIAEICAREAPGTTAANFSKFGITNNNLLLPILKIFAHTNFEIFSTLIETLHVRKEATSENPAPDNSILIEVLLHTAHHNPKETLQYLVQKPIANQQKSREIYCECLRCDQSLFQSDEVPNELDLPLLPPELEKKKEEIIKASAPKAELSPDSPDYKKSAFSQNQIIHWLNYTTTLVSSTATEATTPIIAKFMEDISSFRNPTLRMKLSQLLFDLAKKGQLPRYFEIRNTNHTLRPLGLFSLYYTALESQGVHIPDFLKNPPEFSDEAQEAPLICDTLDLLYHSTELSPDEKSRVLVALSSHISTKGKSPSRKEFWKGLKTNCEAIHALLKNNILSQLKRIDPSAVPPCSELFKNSLIELYPPLQTIPNFDQKYKKTIGSFRNQTALATYRGALKKHPPRYLEALDSCIHALVDEKWQEFRYNPAVSPHLQTIFAGREELARTWQEGVKEQKIEKPPDCSFTDTDDFCDLLLSGTEVTGSCQSVTAPGSNNLGLLGTLMNGENRLFAIKNKQGEIIGRRMSRILWDPHSFRPVLFIEPFYGQGGTTTSVQTTLDNMIVQRARALGLPLCIKGPFLAEKPSTTPNPDPSQPPPTEPFTKTSYGSPLQALGGPAPCVYTDAGGLLKENGIYIIENPMLIEIMPTSSTQ